MLRIAIDGACRRNGKPDCVSAGGVYIQDVNYNDSILRHTAIACAERDSTNQRGELLALAKALQIIYASRDNAIIVTDSEYIFNTMTKGWCDRWSNNGWKTVSGDDVKNADIWRTIHSRAKCIDEASREVTYYHIKGHCIPFGDVTARKLLDEDGTAEKLYDEVRKKFDAVMPKKCDVFVKAQALSKINNGYELPNEAFKEFVVMNTVVDAIATKYVDITDAGVDL